MNASSNINKVVIAALNPINESHSIGSVDGLNFIACAIGSELFILTEDFKKIQVISSCINGSLITAVNCCSESGKIAICCDRNIQIFEPILQNEWQIFPYRWIDTQRWDVENNVDDIQWVLDGFRLLIFADKDLILYQHKVLSCAVNISRPISQNGDVKFTLNPAEDECIWEVIWSTKLAHKIKYVRFSRDGTLFATCGENDPLVKIWYQLKDSQSFSFIYIQHPAPVCGFEWRRSSGHLMARRLVHNALVTWCEDNTVRIWKEIPSNQPSPELHFINAVQNAIALQHEKENANNKPNKKHHHTHRVTIQMRKARGRLMHKLHKHLSNERRKMSIEDVTNLTGTSNDNMIRSSTFADFSIPAYTPANTLVFCLVATINAENDCFLVPSMSSSNIEESEPKQKKKKRRPRPFTVHWLNNKEYEFEIGTQKILAETGFMTEGSRDVSPCQMMHSLHSSTSSAGIATEYPTQHLQVQAPHQSVTAPNLAKAGNQSSDSNAVENPSMKDVIDYKLDKLLLHWSKSCDILFTIHPIDGSLLTWTLEWLDDPWKQPIVSFASRIPEAFSLDETTSLLMHVNTLRPSLHTTLFEFSQHKKIDAEEQTQEDIQKNNWDKIIAQNNEIYLLTEHDNGSLNLWRLPVENTAADLKEQQTLNQRKNAMSVVNVIHGYRMCEPSKEPMALEILTKEGIFDAAFLTNILLPQYHPIQLVGMLNAGRIQRVRAVLINVLRALRFRQQTGGSFSVVKSFARNAGASAIKRTFESDSADLEPQQYRRRNSISALSPFDASDLEYDELDAITPLPLCALLEVDSNQPIAEKIAERTHQDESGKSVQNEESNVYDSLFAQDFVEEELDDKILDNFEVQSLEGRKSSMSRSRKISLGSLGDPNLLASTNLNMTTPTKFTTKHSRLLTEMLTHAHLPGLSSVDQMHLLAVADTISHFSTNSLVDRLAQANAALQPAVMSSLGDSSASGYANAAGGMETIDECGLRFLMAKKQHEYLLRCLPLKQRRQLKLKGISTAYVIWAFHSDTETELLNSIPCCQRQEETWEELRSYGIAWWLRNNATLRICMERVAKNAFQRDQNPLDAAIYYLAMRKKNVLTQLFKTVNDSRMYEFFREDFQNERWKKAALKNAFILMSKQRFHHAAAFFLLGGSIKDALQIILSRIHDLQMAVVVLRLYETDPEMQLELITELLCKEVLGCDSNHILKIKKETANKKRFPNAMRDPFKRSMSLWIMKEYLLSAETLLEEASSVSKENLAEDQGTIHNIESDQDPQPSLPDIFNFYSFLRRHPLVIRQKLARAGIITTTTEQFLTWTRKIGAKVNEQERRLYLRTANAHLTAGCPLLALDVLSSLPEQADFQEDLKQEELASSIILPLKQKQTQQEVDWSAPVTQIEDEKLELEWSADEDDVEDGKEIPMEVMSNEEKESQKHVHAKCPVEFQQLKLHSTLSIITDELNTLATGGYEVTGGQLRQELFCWLEKECEMLRKICYSDEENPSTREEEEEAISIVDEIPSGSNRQELPPLHEVLQQDRQELRERVQQILRRRNWLKKHQTLLNTLAAYCAIHSGRNVRLIAIEMELLLLLLEVQRSEEEALRHVNEPIPDIHSFPLLVSSLSSNVNSPTSPLRFITDQCSSLLTAINEFESAPQIGSDIPKVTKLFNLCQGISFCVYQSLSNIGNLAPSSARFTGPLTQRVRLPSISQGDELPVQSQPNHWPGVNSLIALLTREGFLDQTATPNLRLLLIQFFVSVYVSLFFYAFALYDSRLLYRLAAHPVNGKMFAEVFGGGSEKRLRSAVPARPPPPKIETKSEKDGTVEKDELAAIRAKLHAKVFTGSSSAKPIPSQTATPSQTQATSEQVVQCWISPHKHILQYFMDKIPIEQQGAILADFYDSEQESIAGNEDQNNDTSDYFKFQDSDIQDELAAKKAQVLPHDCPEGYAWILMRLALLRQICSKLEYFIEIAGFDFREVARTFPKLEQVIKKLHLWAAQLEDKLEAMPDGCPPDLLPNMHLLQDIPDPDSQHNQWTSPLLRKYHVLVEPGNTPFEYDEPGVKPVRRLWMQLVRQDDLMPIFVRYIFGKNQLKSKSKIVGALMEGNADGHPNILSVIKLIHREHDPIVAFATNSLKPGHIVLSTGREIQELSIERALEEKERILSRATQFPSTSSYLLGQNRAELDIHMQGVQRDPLRDNDDYQLIVPGVDSSTASGTSKSMLAQTSSTVLNTYIIDRSRLCLQKLRKRPISGIRRLESHGSLPYYVSGSSDGSIFLWEWGVEQPIFIARMAGQYGKVVKLAFALNGNRFAAVDGDGLLCLWQAQPGMPSRKPYFSQKCHNKFVSDVKYIGQTCTLLITAGYSTGDQNIQLWDTIMPQSKAIVHSFVGHPDGAQCIAYQPNTQVNLLNKILLDQIADVFKSIVSGGKHGEICIWDVRQRQLRHTFKAFDSTGSSVKSICLDPNSDIIAAGSNEGDIKIWSATTAVPQLLYSLPTEHVSRSGFSLRQVASISLQGVQQISIDQRMHMFSCGADNSLKIRTIPSLQ